QGVEARRIARAGVGILADAGDVAQPTWNCRGEARMRRRAAIAVEAGAGNAVLRIEAALFTQDQAADPQTGLGAGDEEESGTIGVANADIFDRRNPRQIGGAGGGRQGSHGQARRRTQKKPFEQFHVKSPKARTPSGSVRVMRRARQLPAKLAPVTKTLLY